MKSAVFAYTSNLAFYQLRLERGSTYLRIGRFLLEKPPPAMKKIVLLKAQQQNSERKFGESRIFAVHILTDNLCKFLFVEQR